MGMRLLNLDCSGKNMILNFLSIYDGIFLLGVIKLFWGDPKTNFQPLLTHRFQILAVLR
jgi:hypothetical protein